MRSNQCHCQSQTKMRTQKWIGLCKGFSDFVLIPSISFHVRLVLLVPCVCVCTSSVICTGRCHKQTKSSTNVYNIVCNVLHTYFSICVQIRRRVSQNSQKQQHKIDGRRRAFPYYYFSGLFFCDTFFTRRGYRSFGSSQQWQMFRIPKCRLKYFH